MPAKEVAKAEKPVSRVATTHVVVAKETPYGLAKQYGITLADLEKANPDIKNGLQIGQTLTIPGAKNGTKVAPELTKKKKEKPSVKKSARRKRQKKKLKRK